MSAKDDSFFKRDPALVHTHSVSGATVSPEKRTYPVVLLRAGGSALTTDFTTLVEDLASHCFFVVGFDAPYRSFVVVLPDGRVVGRSPAYHVENTNGNLADPVIGKLLQMWTADTTFVVDQLQRLNADSSETFAARMDLRRLGMFGHSFGGATALEFCHQDSRCKAALDMNGIPFGSVVPEGLSKPGMFLLSDHSREMADPESRPVLAEIQSIYKRLPNLTGGCTWSFERRFILALAIKFCRIVRPPWGSCAWSDSGDWTDAAGLPFRPTTCILSLLVYLNGAPAVALTSIARKYKEVQIEGR